MAHQSLYRRYRPRRFDEVRGQTHVIEALRNAVRDDRVGHAYLFSGPRGTGKTSTARILAKALNCENLDGGEPDGTCESCLAIDAGTSFDVQELDAASNNKVDDIEDLIGRVNLGSPGRTKVYILDEVHMLTAAAANKLLKTLEEPPDHVVFVLATTDPQKVLPTIRSRTQHFQFHLLSAAELAEHVAWVIGDAELGLDADVIDHVVRTGGGSARDTLSALDQVAAAGGVLDRTEALDDLLEAIASADAAAALVAVAAAVDSGRDPRVLGEAVLARLRDVFLVRMGADAAHLSTTERAQVQEWAQRLGDRATTRALEAIGDALIEMRQAPDVRIPLEVALVKLTRVDTDASLDAVLARLAALEAAVASGVAPAGPGASTSTAAAGSPTPAAPGAAQVPPARPAAATPAVPSTPAASSPSTSPAPGGAAPGGGGRQGPAAKARAELAAQRARNQAAGRGGRAAPARVAPPQPAPAGPAVAGGNPAAPSAAPPGGSIARGGASVAGGPAATETPAASNAAAAPSPAGVIPPLDDLRRRWEVDILGVLTGKTKALYRVAGIRSVEGNVVVLAVPNEHQQRNSEPLRGDVEKAFSQVLGTAVSIRLTVDGEDELGHRPPEDLPDDDQALDGFDVHDLPDAPDAPASGLAALTEAFPGAELIDES